MRMRRRILSRLRLNNVSATISIATLSFSHESINLRYEVNLLNYIPEGIAGDVRTWCPAAPCA